MNNAVRELLNTPPPTSAQEPGKCPVCGHHKSGDFKGVCKAIPSPVRWTEDDIPEAVECGHHCDFASSPPTQLAGEREQCNVPECPLGSTIIGWPHPIEEGCIQFAEGLTGCLDDDSELSKALAQISPERLNQILREELKLSPPSTGEGMAPEGGRCLSTETLERVRVIAQSATTVSSLIVRDLLTHIETITREVERGDDDADFEKWWAREDYGDRAQALRAFRWGRYTKAMSLPPVECEAETEELDGAQ